MFATAALKSLHSTSCWLLCLQIIQDRSAPEVIEDFIPDSVDGRGHRSEGQRGRRGSAARDDSTAQWCALRQFLCVELAPRREFCIHRRSLLDTSGERLFWSKRIPAGFVVLQYSPLCVREWSRVQLLMVSESSIAGVCSFGLGRPIGHGKRASNRRSLSHLRKTTATVGRVCCLAASRDLSAGAHAPKSAGRTNEAFHGNMLY